MISTLISKCQTTTRCDKKLCDWCYKIISLNFSVI